MSQSTHLSLLTRLFRAVRRHFASQALLHELGYLSPAMLADIGAGGVELRAFALAAVSCGPLPIPPAGGHVSSPVLFQSTVATVRCGSS